VISFVKNNLNLIFYVTVATSEFKRQQMT